NVIAVVMKQWHDLHARALAIRNECHLVGVDAHVRAVGQIELPELYKYRTAEFRAGRVLRIRRIADVTACRDVAVLILEDAFEHEELLTAGVDVRGERAFRGIAHDCRRPGDRACGARHPAWAMTSTEAWRHVRRHVH